MQKLILIDGHSLAFRGFFGVPIDFDDTVDGVYTNAVRGFFMMLISLIKNERPTHIAVAFDASSNTFRKQQYPEYKAGRAAFPREFIGQIEMIESILSTMQIVHLKKEGYEADDIIATLAKIGDTSGCSISIASGDRDAIQLVNERITLLFPGSFGFSQPTRFTPSEVKNKYGVGPELYADLAAIVGEKADNLPGVPGVGPKTAAKWIQTYGSLSEIVQNKDILPGKAGISFRETIDCVLQNRQLNTLVDSVPLESTLDDLAIKTPDFDRVEADFKKSKIHSLFSRFYKLYSEKTHN